MRTQLTLSGNLFVKAAAKVAGHNRTCDNIADIINDFHRRPALLIALVNVYGCDVDGANRDIGIIV